MVKRAQAVAGGVPALVPSWFMLQAPPRGGFQFLLPPLENARQLGGRSAEQGDQFGGRAARPEQAPRMTSMDGKSARIRMSALSRRWFFKKPNLILGLVNSALKVFTTWLRTKRPAGP